MVIAAILGGGSGARMGTQMPKQFLELGNEAVILHSLRAFLGNGLTDAAMLLVPESFVAYTEALVKNAGIGSIEYPVHVLPGGATRSDTLLCALEFMKANWGLAGNIILTHDAARPFVTKRMIEENIAGAEQYGAVNTCVPATDTIFLSEDGAFLSAVPPRKNVYHAQTPQTFRADELYDLCRALPADRFGAMTDGCSVFVQAGRPVYMARGSENNIKITYPQDLLRAQEILKLEE